MKSVIKVSMIGLLAAITLTWSCSKKEEDPLDDGQELRLITEDESAFNTETELVFDDINKATEETALGKGPQIPGATVNDSSFIGQKRIVIVYTGRSADNRRQRNGTVTVELIEGNRWIETGAVIKVEYNNLRITKVSNNNSVTITGTYYIRNVNGGKAFVDANVTHKLWGGGSVAFDGGAIRTWSIARKRTFENNGGVLQVTTEGDTTAQGETKVLLWGISRGGKEFIITTAQPIVWSSACMGKPMSGVRIIKRLSAEITLTLGVNQNGTPTTSGCPYGYKIEWKNAKSQTRSAIYEY